MATVFDHEKQVCSEEVHAILKGKKTLKEMLLTPGTSPRLLISHGVNEIHNMPHFVMALDSLRGQVNPVMDARNHEEASMPHPPKTTDVHSARYIIHSRHEN